MRGRGFGIQDSGFRAGVLAWFLLLGVVVLPASAGAQGSQVTRSEDTAERAIGQIRS
ncbi:MAG: hypothetical protein H0U67_00380, partial [Gemmatimonadetes bacterium]|nr:hypothetical protein [Gemmatimonadota bacterium]